MNEEPQETGLPMVEAGRYRERSAADERALVVASMGRTWKLEHEEASGEFVLLVYPRNLEIVLSELRRFEAESARRAGTPPAVPLGKIPTVSLFVSGWLMALFFFLQKWGPPGWEERGTACSSAILAGKWWQAVTALTLHGDLSHFAANLAAGLLFAAFILPLFGSGWTWVMILASGAAGNLLNAWGYRDETHFSIGASTAVFGALGILTASQVVDTIRSTRAIHFWEIIVPLGAGLALLAFLGTGGVNTDITAHLWGFLSGALLGTGATLLRLKERTPIFVQRILAVIPPAVLAGAWVMAWGG